MIILKSFYRKKNIRIYLTIITLIFTAIISLFIARNYNVEQANKNMSKSYLMFDANKEEIELLEEMKELSNVRYSIKAYLNSERINNDPNFENSILLFKDENIKTGYASADENSYHVFDLATSNTTSIYLNDKNLNLTINNYKEEQDEEQFYSLYINPDDFNNLSNQVNKYTYIVNLDKWLNKKEVIKELESSIPSLSNLNEHEYNIKILDYSQMNILIFTVLLIVLSIIYIIVLIINIKNILIDENKNTRLYQCLGFTKTTIKKYHILEIASLLILSLIISSLLVTLTLLIF